jgi:FixJ family two-component response regulator
MPKMTGKELSDRMRVVRPAIRTLFVTGYSASSIADRGILIPGAVLLSKPFTASSLLHKVREVLDAS